jgi:MFS transporter, NNP family, nitrate/nitrite transporter
MQAELNIDVLLSRYAPEINAMKGNQVTNLIGPLAANAIAFGPYMLGAELARAFVSLTSFERMLLAGASTVGGGFSRFWASQKADEDKAFDATLILLMISLVGLGGIYALLTMRDVSEVKGRDPEYPIAVVLNALSGAGFAVFSLAVSIGSRSRLNHNFSDRLSQWISGLSPADRMALIAGIPGFMPAILLLAFSYLVSEVGLAVTYGLVALMTLTGQLGLYFGWHNLVFRQLCAQGVPEEAARTIAAHMGQKQVDPKVTFFEKLGALNQRQRITLGVISWLYMISFGMFIAITGTLLLVLSRRAIDTAMAVWIAAAVVAGSTAVRSLMIFLKDAFSPSQLTNLSLVMMGTSLLLFSILEEKSAWLLALSVYAFWDGVCLNTSFAQAATDLPAALVGFVCGVAGGMGGCSAFLFDLMFAAGVSMNQVTGTSADGLPQTTTAYEYIVPGALVCYLGAVVNIIYEYTKPSETQQQIIGYAPVAQSSNPAEPVVTTGLVQLGVFSQRNYGGTGEAAGHISTNRISVEV